MLMMELWEGGIIYGAAAVCVCELEILQEFVSLPAFCKEVMLWFTSLRGENLSFFNGIYKLRCAASMC